eukprot:2715954-Pleurochrysis_carterae.AAC.1
MKASGLGEKQITAIMCHKEVRKLFRFDVPSLESCFFPCICISDCRMHEASEITAMLAHSRFSMPLYMSAQFPGAIRRLLLVLLTVLSTIPLFPITLC